MQRFFLELGLLIGILALGGCAPSALPTNPPLAPADPSTSPPAITATRSSEATRTPTAIILPTNTEGATLTAFPPLPETPIGTSIGVLTPSSVTSQATYAYQPFAAHIWDGVSADPAAWATYRIPYANIVIPVPPHWIVTEWPVMDGMPFFYSASIQPPDIQQTTGCQSQCPEIGITVWRTQAESLESWLDQHATTEPFGTLVEDKPYLHYYGIDEVEPMFLGIGYSGSIRFTHTAMDVPVITIIAHEENVVVSFSATHYGTELGGYTDLAYLMQIIIDGASIP